MSCAQGGAERERFVWDWLGVAEPSGRLGVQVIAAGFQEFLQTAKNLRLNLFACRWGSPLVPWQDAAYRSTQEDPFDSAKRQLLAMSTND